MYVPILPLKHLENAKWKTRKNQKISVRMSSDGADDEQ